MTRLLTSAQMRATETAAIASGEVSGLELMERAGDGVIEAVLEEWPVLAAGGWAVVLCGPGNNGGDGFVIARLLHLRGWRVSAFLYGDPARLPPDAGTNHARWAELGETMRLADGVSGTFGSDAPDLIVDALFGTGLTRRLPAEVHRALVGITDRMHRQSVPPKVVAVDIPSGLCADSGRNRGCALAAGLTVTFHSAKTGHYLAEAPRWCGKVRVADIGLPDDTGDKRVDPAVAQLTDDQCRRFLAKAGGHKYDHGHALVLAGGSGKGGAARLAARGALRVGAGLVTLGCTPEAVAENAARLDAVMLAPMADAPTLARILDDSRLNALCLGPGMGQERACELVPVALAARRATLLDADALSAFSGTPATLFAMLHPACVLTPHGGEFARLFPDLARRLAAPLTDGPAFSKLDAAREAARRAGCVVLVKGPDTVIAAPDGRAAINAAFYDRAVPWLATAGAGDVLAGLIAGLMARGVEAFDAASAAAWLHSEAARGFGPGLIAEDLPDALPRVFRSLGL